MKMKDEIAQMRGRTEVLIDVDGCQAHSRRESALSFTGFVVG